MITLRRLARGARPARPTSPWVLVHSMGKVGSYATFKAIETLGEVNVLHTHQLNVATIGKYTRQTGHAIGHVSEALRFLEQVREEDEVMLIIAIREPIARNVSAFFENLRFFGLENATPADVEHVVDQFITRYPHRIPINWFADQVEAVFGIDLKRLELAPNETSKAGRLSILVQRSEDPDPQRQAALRRFLGTHELRLERLNVGGEKPYAALYGAFRRAFRAPDAMLEALYEEGYVPRFYSADEVDGFRAAWTDP